jgi:hypothetical protein
MALTQTNPLPVAPSRDDPANFSDRADAFFSALVAFQTQQNAQSNEVFNKSSEAILAASMIAAFKNKYLGAFPQNPTVGLNNAPLALGDLYFRTTAPEEVRVFVSPQRGWKGIGSYTTGSIDVTGYIRPATYLGTQSQFKNPPSANLLLNNFTSFLIETNTATQLNFAYTPTALGALDSIEFKMDLITRTGADVSFPSSVRWAGGGGPPTWNKPVFTADRRSIIKFYSSDSGASWLAAADVLNAHADNAPTQA